MKKKQKKVTVTVKEDASATMNSPGQDPGQMVSSTLYTPPLAFGWGHMLEQCAEERGGITELARYLQEIAPASAKLSDDPMTIERGLRRLRNHGNAPANKYGRLLLRCCGLPPSIALWAREMGQYHSRMSDLPVALRADQLRLWDRPPVSESPHAAWVHIGLASLAHRNGDFVQLRQRLALARLVLRHAEPAAAMEMALFEARLAADQTQYKVARQHLTDAEQWLAQHLLTGDEYASYFARLQDQQAYLDSRPWRRHPGCLEAVLARYESIPLADAPPFALFRREHGRAWCLWRMGQPRFALAAAQSACDAAGDGGYLRLRCLSLQLQAEIMGPVPQARQIIARAQEIAMRLRDNQLIHRFDS